MMLSTPGPAVFPRSRSPEPMLRAFIGGTHTRHVTRGRVVSIPGRPATSRPEPGTPASKEDS